MTSSALVQVIVKAILFTIFIYKEQIYIKIIHLSN